MLADVQIPYFNAPIFLENKTQIGKVEEVFGKLHGVVRIPSASFALLTGKCADDLYDRAAKAHASRQ